MPGVSLYNYQLDAIKKMKNGCILHGGVGSGKSRTSLAYYYTMYGGKVNTDHYISMVKPADLYIITTARKRDTNEWEDELKPFNISCDPKESQYANRVVIDSWNNIKKYENVEQAFFIFDEQRVVGYGAWTKAFLKITKKNRWILLSATPGDTWSDYIPVFIANGFYRNKTDFYNRHCVFSRYTKYPKIDKYINVGELNKHRNDILVKMEFHRETKQHHKLIYTDYDRELYNIIQKTRWNIFKKQPIENAGEFCLCLRKLVNSDPSRGEMVMDILSSHPKAIIFYSHDYELDILRELLTHYEYPFTEWNGHKHEPLLTGDKWAYLVEYTAGCEGWNCTSTDTIIFYSQNYSYKVMIQASGRIDRLNTPYTDLYYYHLKSNAKIDQAIANALNRKKKFNESAFACKFADFKKGDENDARRREREESEKHRESQNIS